VTYDDPEAQQTKRMTLEAFADTIIPGEKRWPGDRAVAGVSTGGGAVQAGAVDLLEEPAGGLADVLDDLVEALNRHAAAYVSARGQRLEEAVPPFVALAFGDRTALVADLVAPGHAEREMWVALAMFSTIAFDTGAHWHITDALAGGHPGLTTMGFQPPGPDGLWQFPEFSYRRRLADPHPDTAPSGSLA
jgi:enediyne biosynthesis protein E8